VAAALERWYIEGLDVKSAIMALLFSSHVFCSVFVGMQTGCLNHKSPTIQSVTCSA